MATHDDSDFQTLLDADAREHEAVADKVTQPSTDAVRDALLCVVQSIQRAQVVSAPSKVEPAETGDAITEAGRDAVDALLGASVGGVFRAPVGSRFPVFGAAYEKFKQAMPPPWILRVDDEETYDAWRDDRRAPYIAALADRVAALEDALTDHVADDHAGRFATLERAFDQHVAAHDGARDVAVLGEEVQRARALVESGGDLIPLSVDPILARGVECWQDGDEVVCSVFHRDAAGTCRILTASIPYAACLDGAIRHVVDAGVDPLQIAPVFHRVVQVLGASILIPRIANAASDAVALAGGEVPFLCRVTTPGDPALAAAMSVTQCARGGDHVARDEVRALRAAGAGTLFDRADKQVAAAKKARAR